MQPSATSTQNNTATTHIYTWICACQRQQTSSQRQQTSIARPTTELIQNSRRTRIRTNQTSDVKTHNQKLKVQNYQDSDPDWHQMHSSLISLEHHQHSKIPRSNNQLIQMHGDKKTPSLLNLTKGNRTTHIRLEWTISDRSIYKCIRTVSLDHNNQGSILK